jgi:hypothetical protein
MLSPVLEIYVIWHPADEAGAAKAQQFIEHFHGTTFSGLIGGAVEVYIRSEEWKETGAPRPLPFQQEPAYGIAQPSLVALVPILGLGLAAALEREEDPWGDYLSAIVAAHEQRPDALGVYPVLLDSRATDETQLGQLLGHLQMLGSSTGLLPEDDETDRQIRDLVQGITQHSALPEQERIRVFLSHTKHATGEDGNRPQVLLIDDVFRVITHTRLDEFFDATDLMPGKDWAAELEERASTNALLCVRTDLYSSREWCQREVSIAKRAGMPVVTLDALREGEERGSFLMDHVPRIPGHDASTIPEGAIIAALNQLVDECLKRELWRRQRELAGEEICDWWAPHAPEPLTLVAWLRSARENGEWEETDRALRILHPDPPLGRDEVGVLREIVALIGAGRSLDVLTPSTLAGSSA